MDWFGRPRTPSRLMSLPAEIRATIFEFALTSHKPTVTFRLDTYQRDSYREAVQPALTRVSRQIRHETLPIFYERTEFVLHTEGLDEHSGKARDAGRWMDCVRPYLPWLGHLAFWVRYVTLSNDARAHQGILSVSARYHAKRDVWLVDDHDWRWVTVVRKPAALETDAKILTAELRTLLDGRTRRHTVPQEYLALMGDLRIMYVNGKMS